MKGGRHWYEATACHPVDPFISSTRPLTTAGGWPQLMGLQEGGWPSQEPPELQCLHTALNISIICCLLLPGSISPEYVPRVAAVGSNRTKLVVTLEIRDLYVATTWGHWVWVLQLWKPILKTYLSFACALKLQSVAVPLGGQLFFGTLTSFLSITRLSS